MAALKLRMKTSGMQIPNWLQSQPFKVAEKSSQFDEPVWFHSLAKNPSS